MDKLLTISIAAYNVGKYIKATLNSLILTKHMEQLEVLIVDDGSTDNLKEIVTSFIKEYPNTFVLCEKENGGYGSTINWSIRHANGRFFKILDGDDTVDGDGMVELLDILNTTSADAVVSQAVRNYPDGRELKIYPFIDGLLENKIYSIASNSDFADVAVWGYTFRTDVIKKHWVDLPLHSFYTDRLFVLHTLLGVETLQYQKKIIYKYRVGLNEQSTSIQSIKKHYKEAVKVDLNSIDWVGKSVNQDMPAYNYINNRLALNFAYTYCMFLDLPINKSNLKDLKEFVFTVKNKDYNIYKIAVKQVNRVRIMEKTNYLAYYLWPILKKMRKQ